MPSPKDILDVEDVEPVFQYILIQTFFHLAQEKLLRDEVSLVLKQCHHWDPTGGGNIAFAPT